MFAMFGLGPTELVIVGGLCCIGPAMCGVVVGIILYLNRAPSHPPEDSYAGLQAENQRLRAELEQRKADQN